METLMITSDDRATPYAYQVPKPVYEKFKHYQDMMLPDIDHLLSMIETSCSAHTRRLKNKKIRELEVQECIERSRENAKFIFFDSTFLE